jgi:hypothetical protein
LLRQWPPQLLARGKVVTKLAVRPDRQYSTYPPGLYRVHNSPSSQNEPLTSSTPPRSKRNVVAPVLHHERVGKTLPVQKLQ